MSANLVMQKQALLAMMSPAKQLAHKLQNTPAKQVAHNLHQANQIAYQQAVVSKYAGAISSSGPNMSPTQYAALVYAVGGGGGSTANPSTFAVSNSTTHGAYITSSSTGTFTNSTVNPIGIAVDNLKIPLGTEFTFDLPNGVKLKIEKDGSYQIFDKDAKVVYRANPARDFNKFLNASDRIEEFIKYCGSLGISKHDMLNLPINLFIMWLILEAADADNEPKPDVKLIPNLMHQKFPRCIQCKKFIALKKIRNNIHFCKPKCFERHYIRLSGQAAKLESCGAL